VLLTRYLLRGRRRRRQNIAAHERLTLGDSYSKVWRIILSDEDNIANSVIGM